METAALDRVDPPLPPFPKKLEKRGAKSKFSWKLLLVAVAIGIVAEIFGPSSARMLFQGVKFETVSALIAFFAAFAAAIVLHEAGHLMAALLLDFEILGGSLGPVRAAHFHGKWTFQLSGALLSGSISAIPRHNHSWRKRMLMVVAAGPAATFLTGIASGLLLFNGHFDGLDGLFCGLVNTAELLSICLRADSQRGQGAGAK